MYTVVFYKRSIPILISTLQFTKSVFMYPLQGTAAFYHTDLYELHALQTASLLGTEQSLFYNMAGAKGNGATIFIELIRGGSTPF